MASQTSESNIALALAVGKLESDADPSAIEIEVVELFDRSREQLLRYLSSFAMTVPDSEEVVQETFLALFQHLRRGKSRQNLRGWLFRVAHNLALKKLQRERRDYPEFSPSTKSSLEASMVDPAPSPEDRCVTLQTQKRLLAVLDALPEQERRCLYLRAEGLRYREIAEILNVSLGSVSIFLERSLARISRAAER